MSQKMYTLQKVYGMVSHSLTYGRKQYQCVYKLPATLYVLQSAKYAFLQDDLISSGFQLYVWFNV